MSVGVTGQVRSVFEESATLWKNTKMFCTTLVCNVVCCEFTGDVKTFTTLHTMKQLFFVQVFMVGQGHWVVECFIAHWAVHYSVNCLVVDHQFTAALHILNLYF